MSPKATVVAPSNIAFVKYWGMKDEEHTIPFNRSISMTLTVCVSRCTVEHRESAARAEILVRSGDQELLPAPTDFAAGIERHLERLRLRAGMPGSFRVATENSFPTGAGIASSASGFAALTLATMAALEQTVTAEEASRLAQQSGSGSAARSVIGGYVEWPTGASGRGPARQLAAATDWRLSDLVAVTSTRPKEVSSRAGHRRAPTSPYFERRQSALDRRLDVVRRAIAARSLDLLGPVLEDEAIDLHLIAMSSRPPVFYWNGGTVEVLRAVRRLREQGTPAWATIDAGPNVHVICRSEDEAAISTAIGGLGSVESVIVDRVGEGPKASDEHLF